MSDESINAADVSAAMAAIDAIPAEPAEAAPAEAQVEAAPPAEPPPPEPPPPAPEVDKAAARAERKAEARKLSDLADQELRVLQQRRELDRERQSIAKQQSEMQELMALRQKDPLEFMRRAGLDVDRLTSDIAEGKAKPPDPVQEELAALKKWREELETREKQRGVQEQSEQTKRAIAAEREQLGRYVAENAAQLPFSTAFEPEEIGAELYTVRRDHYMATKTMLDVSVAARRVEESLQGLYQRLHGVATKQTANATSNATPTPPAAGDGRSVAVNTIAASTHRATTSRAPDDMTDDERMAAAIAGIPD